MNHIPALEVLSEFKVFERNQMIFRESHLINRITQTNKNLVFPKNSMLHILDNVYDTTTSDTFNMDRYPYLQGKSDVKYISHLSDLEFDKKDIGKFSHRIYRSNLLQTLTKFNKEYRKYFIYAKDPNKYLGNRNVILVNNCNPLYRLLSTGVANIHQYYRFEAILIHMLKYMSTIERNNFLVVPVPDNIEFSKGILIDLVNTGKVSNSKLVSDNHFNFFMLHLAILLVDNKHPLSAFTSISNFHLAKLNIWFSNGDKSIIVNIGTLAQLADSKAKVLKFISSIVELSQCSSNDTITTSSATDSKDVSDLTNILIIKDGHQILLSRTSHKKFPFSIPHGSFDQGMTIDEHVASLSMKYLGVKVNDISQIDDEITISSHSQKYLAHIATYESVDRSTLETDMKVIRMTPSEARDQLSKQLESSAKGSTGYIRTEVIIGILDKLIVDSRVVTKVVTTKATVSAKLVSDEKYEETLVEAKDTSSIDSLTNEFIDTYGDLTPKQRDRAKVISQKYKSIKIDHPSGAKTVGELLDTPVDLSVEADTFTQAEDHVVDKSMLKSSITSYDKQYNEKLLQRDIISSVVAFQANGLFMTDYTEEDESNNFTRIKHVRVKFEDIAGKSHTVNFKLPIPDDQGYYLVDGIKLAMSKQLINIPICKVSPVRVSLISNYNKTIVEKTTSIRNSFVDSLAKQANKLDIVLTPKTSTFIGLDVPYEYKNIGSRYSKVDTKDYSLNFIYEDRFSTFKIDPILEKKLGTVFGRSKRNRNIYIFINVDNICTEYDIKAGNIINTNQAISKYLSEDIQIPAEWCNLKILDKQLPIIFLLAYRFKLTNILNYLSIDYKFIHAKTKYELLPTDVVIKFSDGRLIFNRYPLKHSYILSGLNFFPTMKNFRFDQLDDPDVFYQLLMDKRLSINYLKGIDNYFSFFVDPITRDVLLEMGEPTNTRDLLIRAVDMLVLEQDKSPSSISNFRLRSTEKLPAIVYNEISRQYANHINSNFQSVSFSINTEAIFQRIIQDQTMTLKEEINPIQAIKDTTRVTYTGFGGRTAQSFVERDRNYPKDAVSILSENTTDSGSVGMISSLSADPAIANLRGKLDTTNVIDKLPPTQVLGDVSLLIPSITHDDPKRANFAYIQLGHHVPSNHSEPARFVTGQENVIAHKTSDTFAHKAKDNGKVISIDKDLGMVKIKYKDKTTEVINIGEQCGDLPGAFLSHDIVLLDSIKVGKTVKKGELLAYHKGFFKHDNTTDEVSWCHGVSANVAFTNNEVTLLDSSFISNDLADKLQFDSIYLRTVIVTGDMLIENHVNIGDTVGYDDTLLRLTYDSILGIDTDVDELFEDISTVEYRAKNSGTIFDIKVFYSGEINSNLKKFVSKMTKGDRKRAKLAKDTDDPMHKYITEVPPGTKLKGREINEDELMICFYIKKAIKAGVGDKILVSSSLKTVIGSVSNDEIVTEHGEVVDVIFGALSVMDRIILSPIISGILDKVIVSAEKDILDIWHS